MDFLAPTEKIAQGSKSEDRELSETTLSTPAQSLDGQGIHAAG